MSRSDSPNRLNLILGDSAGGTFKVAFGRNESLLVDDDVLSCGPTPRRGDLAEWRTLRLKYWRDLVPRVFENYETWPNDVLDKVSRIRDADQITLWAATGVSEQLFLASACNLISTANTPLDRVRLVQFEHLHDRGTRVIGMGELNESRMRQRLDILEGRASNFPTNPIEEWAAGVQLSSSRGALWFRDGERLVADDSARESNL